MAARTPGWPVVVGQYEALWRDLAEGVAGQPLAPALNTFYNQPPYFDAFAHYPTVILPETARLRLTDAGLQVLRGKEEAPVLGEVAECMDPELLRQALAAMQVSGRFGRGYSFAQIVEDMAAGRSCHPDAVRRHLLWLMKYGFAEPEGGFSGLPSTSSTAGPGC